jgi:hypothetical protein
MAPISAARGEQSEDMGRFLMDFSTITDLISTITVAVATVILALLTSRYVRLTAKMADAMRSAQEPSVVVTLEFPDHALNLKVENIGQSSAFDIVFSVLKDMDWLRRGDRIGLRSLPVVQTGISYLAPRQSLRFLVAIIPRAEDLKESHILELSVGYRNESGSQFRRSILLDFEQLKSVRFDSFKDPVEKLTEAILRIESDRRLREYVPGSEMFVKACPVCAETIPKKARKCPRCLEFIEIEADNPSAQADA